jgi:hypothetical protein
VQRWVKELTHKLEAARLSELYERDHAAAAELQLTSARSALSSEQLELGAER